MMLTEEDLILKLSIGHLIPTHFSRDHHVQSIIG